MNKRIILGIVVVVSLVMVGAALAPVNLAQRLGELYKNHQLTRHEKANSIIFSSDVIEVSQDRFEFNKQQYLLAGQKVDDEQMLKEIIVKELLYKEALEAGVTLSDQTVQVEIEKIKSMLSKDKEAYQEFKDFLKASDLTEEAYWQLSFEFYKKAWTTGKYIKDVLRVNYINQQSDKAKDDRTIEKDFSAYMVEYKESLLEIYKINLTKREW